MKIVVFKAEPVIKMEFPLSEGWFILAAMKDFVAYHTNASRIEDWKDWTMDLERKMRNA